MELRLLSGPTYEKPVSSILRLLALVTIVFAVAGCGGTEPPASSTSTPVVDATSTTASSSQGAGSSAPTDTSQASSSSSGQSTPSGQSSAPLLAADGTLKTAMQRVVEADGMRFSLAYTSTMGVPNLDFGFKMDGVASGRLLPNRKVDFTLTMTKGTKGTKHDGEWILYWQDTDLIAYFKNGGQWQKVNENDLHEDTTNFDPTYAYNELGELTTFGPTSLTGAASPDVISQIAATYTLSGTEQLNGEAADRYHLVGEAGGILDLWVSKKTGDIARFQRDVTSNGIGTFAILSLSDVGQPQTIQTPK